MLLTRITLQDERIRLKDTQGSVSVMSRGSEQASKCDELGVTIMVTPGIPAEAKIHLGHISERPAALKNKKKQKQNLEESEHWEWKQAAFWPETATLQNGGIKYKAQGPESA